MLKENRLLSKETIEALDQFLDHDIVGEFDSGERDVLEQTQSGNDGIRYTDQARSFYMTLAFYSTIAYEFVRNEFKNLPGLSTIRKCHQSGNGMPGEDEQFNYDSAFDHI